MVRDQGTLHSLDGMLVVFRSVALFGSGQEPAMFHPGPGATGRDACPGGEP